MHVDQMLLRLSDLAARDCNLAGSKAAVLATLRQGFPVLDGMVLTTCAFKAPSADGEPTAKASPAALRAALDMLADRYGDSPVAVRSSALAEDLPDSTFAGQYETVLDVRGAAAIEDAVNRCWASLGSPEVTAYRQHANGALPQSMAVLVQPMLAPDAAGVALSAGPHNR